MNKLLMFIMIMAMLTGTALAQDSLFAPTVNYAAGTNPFSIYAADFDGDGYKDLATANINSHNVSILINNDDGTFQTAVNYGIGSSPQSVCAADLDGDGDSDLAVANNNSNNVSMLLNNGNGTFSEAVNYSVIGPRWIFAADLDGDDDYDLVTADYWDDNIDILFNNGNATFQAAINYGVGDGPSSIFVADLDGDEDNEIITANTTSDNVSILLNNGGGTFQTAANYSAGDGAMSVFSADLDGDGYSDLVVANAGSNNASVLLNNGNGTFSSATNYGAGTWPYSVFIADIDADEDNDLALANAGSNNVSILLNNGNGTFQTAFNYGVGNRPQSVFAAELDGDGDNDLAAANMFSNNVSVLMNLSCAIMEFHLLSPSDEAIASEANLIWSEAEYSCPYPPVYYNVYWDDNPAFTSPDSITGLTDTTYALTDSLDRSNLYYWKVLAYVISTNNLYSEETFSFYLNGYPSQPVIIAPDNGAHVDTFTYLTWLAGADPDTFDAVSYTILVDDDSLFGSPEIDQSGLSVGLLLDESFSIQLGELEDIANLLADTRYFWRVKSDDNYGLSSEWADNQHWFIYLHQNHAPDPPTSGFSPTGDEEIISLSPTVTWNNAIDPDPDDHPGTLMYYFHLIEDTSTGGYEYYDTTDQGINQVAIAEEIPDNSHYLYYIITVDDEGLQSAGSELQWFWTNHYNYPPEPFAVNTPIPDLRWVNYYTYFDWENTVDYDPMATFHFNLQIANDSLFESMAMSVDSLSATSLAIVTDSLTTGYQEFYWRVLAVDDDSLVRIGGLPLPEVRKLIIVKPGDANGDGLLIGSDVTYLVGYFRGQNPVPDPQMAGDVNGDCLIIGSDVTYLVGYFRGNNPPPGRGDCEPPILTIKRGGNNK